MFFCVLRNAHLLSVHHIQGGQSINLKAEDVDIDLGFSRNQSNERRRHSLMLEFDDLLGTNTLNDSARDIHQVCLVSILPQHRVNHLRDPHERLLLRSLDGRPDMSCQNDVTQTN